MTTAIFLNVRAGSRVIDRDTGEEFAVIATTRDTMNLKSSGGSTIVGVPRETTQYEVVLEDEPAEEQPATENHAMAKSNATKFSGVKFGNVSFGATVASVRATCDRGDHNSDDLVALIVNGRLATNIDLKEDDEGNKLVKGDYIQVKGISDVGGLTFKADTFGFTMSFKKDDIDAEDLSKISNRTGNLMIERTGDADEDSE